MRQAVDPAARHRALSSAGTSPRVKKVLGRLGCERGHRIEREAVAVLNEAWPSRPSWLGSARLGTSEEDAAGVDVVVESDVGSLLLQIKSSARELARFERKRRASWIAGVVADVCRERFRRDLVRALADLRKRVEARRRGVYCDEMPATATTNRR